MKKSLFFIVVLASCLMSCGGDADEPEKKDVTPNYKIHDGNIVGVWKKGDFFCIVLFR